MNLFTYEVKVDPNKYDSLVGPFVGIQCDYNFQGYDYENGYEVYIVKTKKDIRLLFDLDNSIVDYYSIEAQ